MNGASAVTSAHMFGIKLSPSAGGACLLTTLTAAMAAGMVSALSIVLPRRFGAETQFTEASGSQIGGVAQELELLRLELAMIRWEVHNQSKVFQEMLDTRHQEAWPDEAAVTDLAAKAVATRAEAVAAEERARDSEMLRAVRGDMLAGLETQRSQLLEEFEQKLALEFMQSRRQAREESLRLRGAILNSSQTQHQDVVEILEEQLVALEVIQKARSSGGPPKESSAGALVGKGLWGFLASSMKEGDNATDGASGRGPTA